MSLDVSGEGYEDIASALEVMIFQGLNTGDGIVNGIPHEGSGIMSGQSLEVPPNGNGSSWDFGAFFISGGQINYGGQANPDETLTNVLRKLRNKVGGPLDNVTLVITRVSR